MRLIIITILVFNWLSIHCQENTYEPNLLHSLTEYRSNILSTNTDNIILLNQTLDNWRQLAIDNYELNNFIFHILYSKEIIGYNSKSIIQNAPKLLKSTLSKNFTKEQIESIVSNSELVNMIAEGLLENEYPYELISDDDFAREMEFYEIEENESIAEIGAGVGTFSLLLYMSNKNNTIYTNEIKESLLNYSKSRFNSGLVVDNNSQIFFVLGSKKNIYIPEPVDKIIIRNSFHHFKNKKKMLKSIKNNLKDDGKLYINEPSENTRDDCKFILSEQEVKEILNENGFIKRRELVLSETIILEYSK